MNAALEKNYERLSMAGYSQDLLMSIVRQVRNKVNSDMFSTYAEKPEWEKKKTSVVPYVHNVSHDLRRSASGFDAQVSFKFEPKNKFLPLIFDGFNNVSEKECIHPPSIDQVQCIDNVIYQLELKCGKQYVGETGRCFKTRLSEHITLTKKKDKETETQNQDKELSQYSRISSHTSRCNTLNCGVIIDKSRILQNNMWNTTARRLVEGFHIKNNPLNISKAILDPTPNEELFLRKHGFI
jgi:hypothetical protein